MAPEHDGGYDYDALYSTDDPDESPPWEIGQPQPAFAQIIKNGLIGDRVLDAGCGTGDLALHLAERAHHVLGIDISSPAIAKARAKAAERDLTVSFEVADATRLETITFSPDVVFDSGLFHSLDDSEQVEYVSGLRKICARNTAVFVLAVSTDAGLGWGVTRAGLEQAFAAPEWSPTSIEQADVLAEMGGNELHLPALLMSTRRSGD